ncbi:MAG: hypothetical protein PHE73_00050 [Sulfurovaceae bacterium]|nr:hypothetical protein [Sulfurovaceae bacterium]
MKKLVFGAIIAALIFTGCGKKSGDTNATDANGTFEKQGFLTTKWCADRGMFQDCRMESIVCGEGECNKNWEFGDKEKMELVLYVHDDLKYYNVDASKINLPDILGEGINHDQVTIKGNFDEGSNTIMATSFVAPPAGAKSFFKGCL